MNNNPKGGPAGKTGCGVGLITPAVGRKEGAGLAEGGGRGRDLLPNVSPGKAGLVFGRGDKYLFNVEVKDGLVYLSQGAGNGDDLLPGSPKEQEPEPDRLGQGGGSGRPLLPGEKGEDNQLFRDSGELWEGAQPNGEELPGDRDTEE